MTPFFDQQEEAPVKKEEKEKEKEKDGKSNL
jgi:hypothetical protein